MSGSFNRVLLLGRLTRDPELRHVGAGGTSLANFGLAVNRRWAGRDGQEQEEVTFVDVTAWGRTGEVISKYLRKGSPIFVEGRLQLDEWEDHEGKKRSKLKVVAERFEFVESRT